MNRLAPKLADGSVKLEYRAETGHLKSLLAALHVPESSQVLVFTKTSLQRHRIGPATPRALYFNDDVYVGFCQSGDVLEVSAVDPAGDRVLHARPEAGATPRFARQADNCLLCHGSSPTAGCRATRPRSSCRTATGSRSFPAGPAAPTTPARSRRWGGWYVTGTHGSMTHRGNRLRRRRQRPRADGCAGKTSPTWPANSRPPVPRPRTATSWPDGPRPPDLGSTIGMARATLEGRIASPTRTAPRRK